MTILAWIKVGSLPDPYGYIINRGNSNEVSLNYYFRVALDGSLLFGFTVAASTYAEIASSAGDISTGVWTHVAARYDGSNQKIYKNGAEIATRAETGTPSTSLSSPNHRIGGSSQSTPQGLFNGDIAEIEIYSSALSVNEILARSRGARITAIPVARWTLWGLNDPEPDLSGGGNTGAVTGATLANHAPITLFTPKWAASVPLIEVGGGGVTVTPAASEAIAETANPGVVLGSLLIAPATSEAIAETANPAVVLGSVSVSPVSSEAIAETGNPLIVLGSLSIAPPAAEAIADTVNPSVSLGSMVITPALLEAICSTLDPTVTVGDPIVQVQAIRLINLALKRPAINNATLSRPELENVSIIK